MFRINTTPQRILLRLLITTSVLMCGAFDAKANGTTYYLAPTGSDSASGTLTSPWNTFAFALTQLVPGDTLVVKDGTYDGTKGLDFPDIDCAAGHKNGTASLPINIRAETERRAFLKTDGSTKALQIRNCSYWTFNGLRVQGADFDIGVNVNNIQVDNCSNLTFRRFLVSHTNRYMNDHLMTILDSSSILVEESEFYYFHRHAILNRFTDNSVYRRNYCNSRGYADIPGGKVSENKNRGEMCVSIYPGSNNIIENTISEGNSAVGDIQAFANSTGNKFLGDVSLNDVNGITFHPRGPTTALMPRDNIIENYVAITPKSRGLKIISGRGNRIGNSSVFNSTKDGIVTSVNVEQGDGGPYTFFLNNCLVFGSARQGYRKDNDTAWGINFANAYNNAGGNFSPAADPAFVDTIQIDPEFGSCYLWVPENSPLKGAGKNGADIGANIVYRYENGVLTNTLLWNPTTGSFPCGAIVAGLNDSPGASCFDVNKRLNVNAGGCFLPSSSDKESTNPSAPKNLRIVLN